MSASQLPTARRSTRGTFGFGGEAALVLGRYRLQRRLGAGAFGTVWMGHDERLGRDVAVKLVPRERIVGGRFEREARAAARLTHPGIVTLYEAAIDDDDAYLVSELIRGETLAHLLEAGRLSDRDIVEISISLCDALGYAHAESIVHRDVKPSNVLIPDRPTSGAHPAKLTDFGVARLIGGDSLTRTGDVVGTAAYMAPEQAEGRPAGPPADLYALALVSYEALTGINPIRMTTAATRARRLGAHLPPLRRQRRDLPRELGRGIDLALRPRPRERGTLEELRASLVASLPALSDEPGVVATAWPRARAGGGATAAATPAQFGPPPPAAPPPQFGLAPPTAPPPAFAASANAQACAAGARVQDAQNHADVDADAPDTTPPVPWPARALGATAAAIATAWLAAGLLGPLPVAPAAIGIVAWLLVLALPRVGWLATSTILIAGAVARHHPGGALVIAIAALIPLALMPRRGTAWPLAIGAPLLGIIGLAGAWPAIAARAGASAWRRAALGATGYVWLTLVAPLAGADLYTKRPQGIPAAGVWTASLGVTAHHVLGALFSAGTILAAGVWAIGAAVLPWLLRTRSLATTCVLVTVWSAVLLSATETAIVAFHGTHGAAAPPRAVAGAVVGALTALAPALINAWRKTRYSGNPRPELP
jgi:eukaryotic-like serine/threonine-protein kinase